MEISDREFHRLVDYMHDNFGINLSSKRVLIQGRLGNMLRERGFTFVGPDCGMVACHDEGQGTLLWQIPPGRKSQRYSTNSQQTTPSLCASRSITPTLKR